MSRRTKPLPSQQELLTLLRYDPETGKLYWRERDIRSFVSESRGRTWNTRYANREAFTCTHPTGHKTGRIHSVAYLAHRVIFKLIHDVDAVGVDHIRGCGAGNRDDNLREATQAANTRNAKQYSHNTSGHRGVYWDKPRQHWHAAIRYNRKLISLGRYHDKERAIAARIAAERLYGFHENHGRIA